MYSSGLRVVGDGGGCVCKGNGLPRQGTSLSLLRELPEAGAWGSFPTPLRASLYLSLSWRPSPSAAGGAGVGWVGVGPEQMAPQALTLLAPRGDGLWARERAGRRGTTC